MQCPANVHLFHERDRRTDDAYRQHLFDEYWPPTQSPIGAYFGDAGPRGPKHHIPELGRKPGTDAFFDLKTHPDGETYHDLKILRFDGGLFFANAGALEDHLRQLRVQSGTELTGVILSMEGVDYIDTEGSDAVREIAQAGRDLNIDLHLARVKPQVLEVLERDGAIDVIGADRVHADIEHAVEFHLSRSAPT